MARLRSVSRASRVRRTQFLSEDQQTACQSRARRFAPAWSICAFRETLYKQEIYDENGLDSLAGSRKSVVVRFVKEFSSGVRRLTQIREKASHPLMAGRDSRHPERSRSLGLEGIHTIPLGGRWILQEESAAGTEHLLHDSVLPEQLEVSINQHAGFLPIALFITGEDSLK